jgi:hypothetical protein
MVFNNVKGAPFKASFASVAAATANADSLFHDRFNQALVNSSMLVCTTTV